MGGRILRVYHWLKCHHVGCAHIGKQENKKHWNLIWRKKKKTNQKPLFSWEPLALFSVSTHICIFLSKNKIILAMLFHNLLFHLETYPKYIFSGHCAFSCLSSWIVNSPNFCFFIRPCTQHRDKYHRPFLPNIDTIFYWFNLVQGIKLYELGSSYPSTLPNISLAPILFTFLSWLCFSTAEYHFS